MEKKIDAHTFQGMQRDLAVSKHPANYLFDARNIRLTQREDGSTLLAVTNEKGTGNDLITISGDYLGHCVVGKYLVVFSTGYVTVVVNEEEQQEKHDYIERFDLSTLGTVPAKTVLFNGNLGFDDDYPIEAIGSYENENVQKVYWTDGLNQPRVINIKNIAGSVGITSLYTKFDFVSTLALEEEVSVKKMKGGGGMFAPGVIQYAFTYYRKYGQETCIFYTTPLLYISYTDRGGSPEDKISTAFNITINKLDEGFDYLRIYSIQRTSLNGTPIVKRLQDISVNDAPYISGNQGPKYASFTDTGTEGDTIDPTELLYKGGEEIVAQTLEQKDGTLFLGNIEVKRNEDKNYLWGYVESMTALESAHRSFTVNMDNDDNYEYGNQLSAVDSNGNSVPCNGFKYGNYYRLGVQFQHKSGKWSDPILVEDVCENNTPSHQTDHQNKIETIIVPTFKGTFADGTTTKIHHFTDAGYIKIRGVVVFPEAYDRVVQCQGVVNPTLKYDNSSYYQSSWFYRPVLTGNTSNINSEKLVSPKLPENNPPTTLPYLDYITDDPSAIQSVEIQGIFSDEDKFKVYKDIMTLDTPDVEFDTELWNFDFTSTECRKVGLITFDCTLSDIDIQTETPSFSSRASGFIHKSFSAGYSYGIAAGLFYDDFVIDDYNDSQDPSDDPLKEYTGEQKPVKWMVYPWHKTGSLNNDFNRPVSLGTRTALLKKKVISNLRYADITHWDIVTIDTPPYTKHVYTKFKTSIDPKLFSSDQLSILKFGNKLYQGNVDTLLNPSDSGALYFAHINFADANEAEADFDADISWKVGAPSVLSQGNMGFVYKYNNGTWSNLSEHPIGDKYPAVASNKEPVRMKYKSSPHLIIDGSNLSDGSSYNYNLPVVEICTPGDDPSSQTPYYRATMFGGITQDALKANVWLPAGEPVKLTNNGQAKTSVEFEYSWGDTYFQRYDCLKTYAFTPEDINQVVEIGSFMLETYVNIDGRYDRNRGQLNNLNMSPVNFNLYNPVYSQRDNFFNYRILDASFYENSKFPNQITWSREKQAGAEIDPWTSITLASTYDMDGSKGEITSLNLWKDTLFCFQNKGISNILFNSRVQIPTSDGIPIEISNSYKVDGYRYLSDGIGCTNKWTIKETPANVYFIDSMAHHLYSIGEGLSNITLSKSMGSWFNDNGSLIQRTVYDEVNHDVYLIKETEALCFNEQLNEFTSFMDYGGINLMEAYQGSVYTLKNRKLYEMFTGAYNNFFDVIKPWSITFVSNGVAGGLGTLDKIFTNVEYRMDMFASNGAYDGDSTFDYVKAWNEYQDTGDSALTQLSNGTGYRTSTVVPGNNPQKKFKIWRIQIPRALKTVGATTRVGIDRIRNPWCKITLGKNNNSTTASKNQEKAILHDLGVVFYV